MVRLTSTHRITATETYNEGQVGGGDVTVQLSTPGVTITSSDTEGALVQLLVTDANGVSTMLPERTGGHTIPFTITEGASPAIRGVDYNLSNNASLTGANIPVGVNFFRMPSGSASTNFYVKPVIPPGQASGPGGHTFTLDLVSTNADGDTLSPDVDLGTIDTLTGTLLVNEPPGTPEVSWQAGATSTQNEPDTDTVIEVVLVMQPVPEVGTASVTYDFFAGSAVGGGVDYTATSGSASWEPGDAPARSIPITLHHNSSGFSDTTIILTLSSPTNCDVVGSTTHTISLLDRDTPATVNNVGFDRPTATLLEGGADHSVIINIQNPDAGGLGVNDSHVPIVCRVEIDPTSTASSAEDYQLLGWTEVEPGKANITIDDGRRYGTFTVRPRENAVVPTTPRTLTFTVTAIVSGPGALGLVSSQAQSITFSNNDGSSGDDPDGVPVDYQTGALLFPLRVQFDEDEPDIEIWPNSPTQPGSGRAGSQGRMVVAAGQVGAGTSTGLSNPVGAALTAASAIMSARIGSDSALAALTMGSSVENVVKIRCHTNLFGTSNVGRYVEDSVVSVFPGHVNLCETGRSYGWPTCTEANVGQPVIRNVLFYGHTGDTLPEMGALHLSAEGAYLDNVRFERLNFVNRDLSGTQSALAGIRLHRGSAPTGENTGHGRIKVYDCRYTSDNSPDSQGYVLSDGILASYRAAWDVRNRNDGLGHNQPAIERCRQHGYYFHSLTGVDTYPGFSGQASVVCNVENDPALPNERTLVQMYNRKNENPGTLSSGDFVLCRVNGRGTGAPSHAFSAGGSCWTIGGHGGRVYLYDCELTEGATQGQNGHRTGGGLSVTHEYQSDHNAALSSNQNNYFAGTTGEAHVIESPASSGRLYTTDEVVIDGMTINSSHMQNRAVMQLIGVRKLTLVRFNIVNNGSDGAAQLMMQPPGTSGQTGDREGPWPGLCFTEEVNVASLKHPTTLAAYSGSFSAYPGWGTGTKIRDWYHANWWQHYSNNAWSLTNAEVDVYPGGSSSSLGASVIGDQYLNRMTATGDGLGTITVAGWSHDAAPDYPQLTWENATVYVGEPNGSSTAETFYADMLAASQCEVLGRFETGPGTTLTENTHFQYNPNTSPYSMEGPQDAADEWDHFDYGFEDDGFTVIRGRLDRFAVTVLFLDSGPAWGPGSETIEVQLEDGGVDPTFEYPKGSGTYVAMPDGTNKVLTIKGVPVGEYPVMDFSGPNLSFEAAELPVTFNVIATRTASSNSDSIQLVSSTDVAITSTVTSYTSGKNDGDTITWTAGDASEQWSVTINSGSAGQFLQFRLGPPSTWVNVTDAANGGIQPAFNITIE